VPAIQEASDPRLRALLDPRWILRWVYVGRVAIGTAVFLAALFAWGNAEASDTLVATLIFTGAIVFTGASGLSTEIYRNPVGVSFLYLQSLFDLVLVTAVVHVTGGGVSQFAALYILVIASSALLLPVSGGFLVAALGCVLYVADVIVAHDTPLDLRLWLQFGVFATVALGSGWIASRLRAAKQGTEELAAELVKVRLQAADILRNIRSGVVTIDGNGRLLYANPAASTLLGMTLEENVGRPVLETIAAASLELARALERAVAESVRTPRAEGFVTAGQRTFPIGLHTTCSESNGAEGLPTATAIFQDISDQKRLDELHLRAERLEGVAELSASLAHEIKNPLASIRSAVEQLAHSPRTTADERSLAHLIVRESDRLSRLLSEFLDFARVRVSRVAPVDIHAIACGAANLAAAHPDREAGVEVSCSPVNEPLIIEGDEDLLHRAVFNLTLNAVQASPREGKVRVELEPLTMDQVPAGVSFDQGGIALRVTDNGPGIPADIRDRLFDPFFTTKPGGSGLGLPVVHRAIEAHKGFVFIDSDGKGTRVTVLLPRSQSEPGDPE
jgi:two-component system, NtrC family, sensor histidine kinase PilS